MNNQLLTLSDLAWPISWRWHIQTHWGVYNTVLTVDAPELQDKPLESRKLGKLLYSGTVAQATVRDTHPFWQETVCWKVNDVPVVDPMNTQQGWCFGGVAPKRQTGVIVMHTGDDDGRARRRWFLGGMPADWQRDGQLTLEGAEQLQTIARSMICGLVAGMGDMPMRWLLAYPRAVPGDGLYPAQPAFRYVSHLRVCYFTERVPELSQAIWPQDD